MAGIMTGMRVEGATVIGAQPLPPSPGTYRENHRRSHPQQLGAYGLIAAILLALLIGGVALRDRQGTRPVASVTEHVNKTAMLPAGQGIGPQEYDAILTALEKVGTASTQAVRGYTPRFGLVEHDQIRSTLEMANDALPSSPVAGELARFSRSQ